jgi:hypothetical protein
MTTTTRKQAKPRCDITEATFDAPTRKHVALRIMQPLSCPQDQQLMLSTTLKAHLPRHPQALSRRKAYQSYHILVIRTVPSSDAQVSNYDATLLGDIVS